jgi:hypothetical protein
MSDWHKVGKVPVGTTVIKRDFGNDGGRPGLFQKYLVMRKMEPGYGTAKGDWYYAVRGPDVAVMGPAEQPMEGKVPMCIGCHSAVAATDFLFGVPDSVRKT